MTAYEVIQKYGWVQGSIGDCGSGFCLLGAVWEAHGQKGCRFVDDSLLTIGRLIGKDIDSWNDDPKRTKRQVLAVLKKAGV